MAMFHALFLYRQANNISFRLVFYDFFPIRTMKICQIFFQLEDIARGMVSEFSITFSKETHFCCIELTDAVYCPHFVSIIFML